ncbi:MAG TPA: serine hydrolase [Verrucomicrobiae bacterium]|jgi:CubicO group peptidase (beta-lactamase class C family)
MMSLHRRSFLARIGLGAAGIGLAAGLPEWSFAQKRVVEGLPRSTPEEQGVSSAAILAFLDEIHRSKHEFQSFMFVRNGHVIAEGWWTPYRKTARHMLYSLSKSFTSTAVGFAVAEGKLSVNDTVISFFPDDRPATISENLAALRVKHLLTMSAGHATDTTPTVTKEQNWPRAFLALDIAHPPGTEFLYNSGATYMLSAIVQTVTGRKVIDYLRPHLFEPLEMDDITWEICPRGINTGGWGLSVRTESLAKFGQFYLQKGAWNGRQILPAAWVEEATTFKIQQPAVNGADLEKTKLASDWHQGYCCQFWRCRHNAFRGDGAFGQFDIVMPDQKAVVAITSETGSMQGELDLVWKHLLPAMKDQPLPADALSHERLERALASLALPFPDGKTASPMASQISGKTFKVESNSQGIENVSFQFQGGSCVFSTGSGDAGNPITCGLGQWADGVTNMPGVPPKITVGDLRPAKVAAAAAWRDDHTLEMRWRFYETPHSEKVTCQFEGDKVKIEFLASIAEKSGHPDPHLMLRATAV